METSTISISSNVITCTSSKLWCIVQNIITILRTNYMIFSCFFVLPNVISYEFKYYIEVLQVNKAVPISMIQLIYFYLTRYFYSFAFKSNILSKLLISWTITSLQTFSSKYSFFINEFSTFIFCPENLLPSQVNSTIVDYFAAIRVRKVHFSSIIIMSIKFRYSYKIEFFFGS